MCSGEEASRNVVPVEIESAKLDGLVPSAVRAGRYAIHYLESYTIETNNLGLNPNLDTNISYTIGTKNLGEIY